MASVRLTGKLTLEGDRFMGVRLGDVSIQGNIKPLRSLVESLQVRGSWNRSCSGSRSRRSFLISTSFAFRRTILSLFIAGKRAWNQTFDLVQLSDQAKHFGARLRVVLAGFIELPFDVRPAMGESKLGGIAITHCFSGVVDGHTRDRKVILDPSCRESSAAFGIRSETAS